MHNQKKNLFYRCHVTNRWFVVWSFTITYVANTCCRIELEQSQYIHYKCNYICETT
jgi:hypothetical protein